MLDPNSMLAQPLFWAVLIGVLTLLAVRMLRRDRREYRRFKRYRSTAQRQRTFRRWLLHSFLTFGGLSVVALLVAGERSQPLRAELLEWPALRHIADFVSARPDIVALAVAVVLLALVLLTWAGVRAVRSDDEGVIAVGDIHAILPRNRSELRWTALLAINAGVVEELAFRLAIPALVFGATGSAIVATVSAVLLFGALHLYQGVAGVIATTLVGAIMMTLWVVSDSILAVIIVHVVFDLRSLVIIPMAVNGVHRVPAHRADATVDTATAP